MRLTLMIATTKLAVVLAGSSPAATVNPASAAADGKKTSATPPLQSGIYGFSGGKSDIASDPEGVIGECIWVYGADDKTQVAKGICSDRRPGQFRVVLAPGRYVVHGPGGNQKVEIKPGKWVSIRAIVLLPLGP